MNSLILKFRKYGIVGCLSALLRLLKQNTPLHQAMLRMAAGQTTPPQRGITIIGDMTTHASLPKVLCDLCQKLKACDIPCQCLDTSKPLPQDFDLLRYDNVIGMLSNPLPRKIRKCVRTSVIAFWEFDSGLLNGYPHLADGETIIAMSDFNFTYYSNVLPPKRVRKLLYPLELPAVPQISPQAIRQKFGIPQDAFVVFYNFELGTRRKNPEGIVSAFAKAFTHNENAVLVFKTMSARRVPECLEELNRQARALGIADRFVTVNDYLPVDELLGLTNACDVYMSLHRGEGFGLGIAEAMHFSKPVIATDWSATTEFCNTDNAILIPYEMQPLHDVDYARHPYEGVTAWAEPDIDAAASALRRLYGDPDLRRRLGENGRRFVNSHFSLENFKRSAECFLAPPPCR